MKRTPPRASIGINVPESPLVKEKEEAMEKHTVAAVDVAKVVFDVALSDEPGRVRMTRRLPRSGFLPFFAQLPAAIVVMEACGSAHYWARRIQELGHQVVLLPPHQVRPDVTRNKTDRTDAKGILEAHRNADIRPVPVKAVSQKVLPQVRTLISDADSEIPDALRPVRASSGSPPGNTRSSQELRNTRKDSPTPALLSESRDGETGRTGERKADNKLGLRGRFHRLAPLARTSSWPGAAGLTREAEDTFAVLSLFATTDSEPVPVPRPFARTRRRHSLRRPDNAVITSASRNPSMT